MKKERHPDFSKMKWVKGFKINPEAFLPANVKVRITTYISEDIYRWLKKEADRTGTPYQILLNQKLRQVYETGESGSLKERIERLEGMIRKMKVA